ncbi:MAG: rRNA maturation RNase YbeY [Clostridia bacterium]|nr:rRNA maturation RNase YbeY [Clostridia bacterium]
MAEIDFLDVKENRTQERLIKKVIRQCFEIENMLNTKFYVSVTLTTPEIIRRYNKEYRNIDKETDVLSFPMFEKDEITELIKSKMDFEDVLGDMIISVEKVKKQAEEFGHSFERELSYMVVHSFYHLMGEDHIKEQDKKNMRKKEETVLNNLNIKR